ncbi:MAG: hypothetical protein ABII79_12600 [bacterium]
MAGTQRSSTKCSDDLVLLDDLIRKYHKELRKTVKEHAKLGDFIKMIELKHKLAPGNTDQKQFWRMLEKIRREALKQEAAESPPPKKRMDGTAKAGTKK